MMQEYLMTNDVKQGEGVYLKVLQKGVKYQKGDFLV
jgi:hypothetical protein